MEREIHEVLPVAQRAAELLSSELAQGKHEKRAGLRRFIGLGDKVVGKLVTWVGLIRAIDFLKGP